MVRRENSPGAISDNAGTIAQGGTATVHDRLGVYIAIIALLVAGMGLGYEISQSSSRAETRQLQDQLLDAKIRAGMSEVRASTQQAIAQAQATAQAGKEHARIALDEVQRSNAQLEAKGLIRPANH